LYTEDGGGFDGKLYETGVEFPDIGGVAMWLLFTNGIGDARAEETPIAGLNGKAGEGPRDMFGDTSALLCIGSLGEDAAEDPLSGLCRDCPGG
jgi:hypothetical protein